MKPPQKLEQDEFKLSAGRPEPKSPLITEFVDYWLDLVRDGQLASRSDIDPMAIPGCLPHVWIYRAQPRLGLYQCELSGEAINTAWGQNIKGYNSLELFGHEGNGIVARRWRFLLENNVYAYSRFLGSYHAKSSERIAAPFLDEEGNANIIFGITIYDYLPELDILKSVSYQSAGFRYFSPFADSRNMI